MKSITLVQASDYLAYHASNGSSGEVVWGKALKKPRLGIVLRINLILFKLVSNANSRRKKWREIDPRNLEGWVKN